VIIGLFLASCENHSGYIMDDNHHDNILGKNDNYFDDEENSSFEDTEDGEEGGFPDEMEPAHAKNRRNMTAFRNDIQP
jgi:hypothetical protein